MPSTPYDLVKDEQDLRIPLHAEQAFFHGITFQAKVCAIWVLFYFVHGMMADKTVQPKVPLNVLISNSAQLNTDFIK